MRNSNGRRVLLYVCMYVCNVWVCTTEETPASGDNSMSPAHLIPYSGRKRIESERWVQEGGARGSGKSECVSVATVVKEA